jgi:hypothetical protein
MLRPTFSLSLSLFFLAILLAILLLPSSISSNAVTTTAQNTSASSSIRRRATSNPASYACDPDSVQGNAALNRYFDGMGRIYSTLQDSTCLPVHKACGWPTASTRKNLPLMVLSVGLEGAGHHLWTELMAKPLFDCVWINARHYRRDVGDGVARTSPEELKAGFQEQVCRSYLYIYPSSFIDARQRFRVDSVDYAATPQRLGSGSSAIATIACRDSSAIPQQSRAEILSDSA